MNQTFILTGLQSRGGLSNWVFFFGPEELVLVDVGMGPALRAGVLAGLDLEGGPYGPQPHAGTDADTWLQRLGGRARRILRKPLVELRAVRLQLRLGAHQLVVEDAAGRARFSLMNRHEAEPLADRLTEQLGERFRIQESGPFRFLKRHAPFLTR
ncbi:MAG: hypothetical protein U1A78_37040 [Polyangia bacterium]